MSPRVVKPRNDRPMWPLVGGLALACTAVGYVAAARVFDPGAQAHADENGEEGPVGPTDDGHRDEPTADAGSGAHAAETPAPPTPVVEAPPRVGVRVTSSVTQSCGDGEELNIPGPRCETVPGADEPIRRHLQRLGDCPSAEAAAATPTAVLSIGLRVDYARHRVTALPGRSSSVRNAMTFVPCARAAFEHADDLWRVTPPHPRYLYFYSLRFTPPANPAPPTVTPSATAPDASAASARDASTATPSTATPSTATPSTATPSTATPSTATQSGATPSTTTPSTATPSSSGATTAVHGTLLTHPEAAPVVWERVVVRDAPRTGAIVGHLVRGDQVTLLARENGWFEIRFTGGNGWIFGAAVGR